MIFIWILKIIIIIIISIDKMSILTILNSQSNQIHDIPTHKLKYTTFSLLFTEN